MEPIKALAKSLFHKVGLEVTRYRPTTLGIDPDRDIRLLIGSRRPVVIDVGANVGQSVIRFKKLLPGCEIHSFEPSPATFKELERVASRYQDVRPNNVGVGSSCGELTLQENTCPDMSSFLKQSEFCWGDIIGETKVPVVTLDSYCEGAGISRVDLLKTDTQGFDFEVLKGAEALLTGNRVRLVYTEVIYSDMYQGLPPFEEFYRHMLDRGFHLVAFYHFGFQRNMASWSDALFVNHSFEAGNHS